MRLIHLTDPHLSSLQSERFSRLRGKRRSGYLSWRRNRQFVHLPEVLERITRSVQLENADLILVTGDLVHIGLDHELATAAEWLQRLGTPDRVLLLPGNHDNYAADSLESIYRHLHEYLPATSLPPEHYTDGYPVEHNHGKAQLIGLNSSCVTRIFSAAGELGDRQRTLLRPMLQSGKENGKFQVLLIHHPPFPGMTSRRKALRDDRELEILCRESPPDLVLYGHLHRDNCHAFEGARVYGTGSASYADGASYRVFDIEESTAGWNCEMRLMKTGEGEANGSSPSVFSTETWFVRKSD